MVKKKKKKETGKSGNMGPVIPEEEIILNYRIGVRKEQVEKLQKEMKELEEQKEMLQEKKEKAVYKFQKNVSHLMKQAESHIMECLEAVEQQQCIARKMQEENNIAEKEMEMPIKDLKDELHKLDVALAQNESELEKWHVFADHGQKQQQTEICNLEEEIARTEREFKEMEAFLCRSLEMNKCQLREKCTAAVDREKAEAAERALKIHSRQHQNIKEYGQLKKEVKFHKETSEELIRQVEQLKKGNEEILNQLLHLLSDSEVPFYDQKIPALTCYSPALPETKTYEAFADSFTFFLRDSMQQDDVARKSQDHIDIETENEEEFLPLGEKIKVPQNFPPQLRNKHKHWEKILECTSDFYISGLST